jgi:NTE family protein/lysophospholipid hydrolase
MGAVVAAQHAQGWDYETILQLHRKTWMSIKTVRATTLPLVSIVSSRKFDQVLRTVCGDAYIENLWVNYFCVSANLATAEMVIHQSGPVWKAARASSSVPGMVPPVLEGNNLLVDGGVLDNLPGNTMKTLCGGKVIAVNVSPSQDQNFTLDDSYHRIPSPLEIVRSNFNPFQKTLVVPNIVNLMMRTTMLSSVHKANQVKEDVDFYFRPPVDHFGLVEYESFDEIVQVGHEYAARQIEEWSKEKSFKW